MKRIGIIGAGAWGTALSTVVCRAGRDAVLWAREAEVVEGINRDHENSLFLPGVKLDERITATGSLAEAADADALLLVVPAQFLRAVTGELGNLMKEAVPVVLCAKGIERDSGALMTEVVADILPGQPVAVLSGPTFAAEVAGELPTAVTLAAEDDALGARLEKALGGQRFRIYRSGDVAGAEIGGAVKNVLAIACGITEGRGFGSNGRAALITRGLAEMIRLCLAKGGRAETMMGLCGLGDLVLTCSSRQSRNYSVGVALGEGAALDDVLAGRVSVAEGVESAGAVDGLARTLGIEMPIVAAVHAVLSGELSVDHAITGLLARPFRSEEQAADASP